MRIPIQKKMLAVSLVMGLYFNEAVATALYTVTDLGSFDAYGMNDAGQIVGDVNWVAMVYENGQFTSLGTLGGPYSSSNAYDINNNSQVVGTSNLTVPGQDAFIYANGQMTDLGFGGFSYNAAMAINDLGQVVGITSIPDGYLHPFLYSNGQMIDLG